MSTARDVMTAQAHCVTDTETILNAAQKMRDLDVGSLPITDADGKLIGMLTDRDIVVRGVAAGSDLSTAMAGEFAAGEPLTITPDSSAEVALQVMSQNQVRRLPVVEDGRMVGMISQQDIAAALSAEQVGQTVEAVTASGGQRSD